jgi:hypothetical protein
MIRIAFSAAALCVLGVLLGPVVAGGKSYDTPPPIPACFKTGSGYGLCQGMVIPGDGTIVKITVANKKDEFKLTGPAPLQTTKPVACGDAGCVYNHLNWSVGPGATVVKGCQPNTTTCDVTVAPGSRLWTAVYVRQNNDSPILYAIWNSGKTGFTLSGKILATSCGIEATSCSSRPSPVSGVSVTASGAGSGSAISDTKGNYSMTLAKGKYTVTPHDGDRAFRPDSLGVDLTGDKGGVDFETCAVVDNIVNGTLQRGSVETSAEKTVTLQGSTTKNFVKLEVTPCGDSATVKVESWVSRPECEANTDWTNINPYTKKFLPAYKPIGGGSIGPFALNKAGAVDVLDSQQVKIMHIVVAKNHQRAAVEIFNASASVQKPFPNALTAAGGNMNCRPQGDTFALAPK